MNRRVTQYLSFCSNRNTLTRTENIYIYITYYKKHVKEFSLFSITFKYKFLFEKLQNKNHKLVDT